jgi:DNA-directed RNA polymerase-5 subunit 1
VPALGGDAKKCQQLSSYILAKHPYMRLKVVGLPPEVAKRITFEEQVTDININRLQEVVDK